MSHNYNSHSWNIGSESGLKVIISYISSLRIDWATWGVVWFCFAVLLNGAERQVQWLQELGLAVQHEDQSSEPAARDGLNPGGCPSLSCALTHRIIIFNAKHGLYKEPKQDMANLGSRRKPTLRMNQSGTTENGNQQVRVKWWEIGTLNIFIRWTRGTNKKTLRY